MLGLGLLPTPGRNLGCLVLVGLTDVVVVGHLDLQAVRLVLVSQVDLQLWN